MTRTRRGLTAAAAVLTTSALLFTTACGSDDSGDDLAGVDTGDAQTDDESDEEPDDDAGPQPGEDDGIDRPDVTLPDYMNNEHADPETDDPVEQAVIYDAQQRRDATDLAIDTQDPELEGLAFYNDGEGLIAALDYIANAVSHGTTWSGTTRLYGWEVERDEEDEDIATVTFCMDENEAFEMDPDTGEVTEREATDSGFVEVRERTRKNELGVWQRISVHSERGTEQCLD